MPDSGWIGPAIVPEICYRDARAGMAFIADAFGFTPSLVVAEDGSDRIEHAELWMGDACIMLASIDDIAAWRFRTPCEFGGVNTGSPYIATTAIDELYTRAVAAGATIVAELAATDYGSRDFSAVDPEGHLWHFGTYRPRGDAAPNAPAELFTGGRYGDARAAIALLSTAFGAVEDLIVPDEGNAVAHAQLRIGDGVFMLSSARDDRFNLTSPQLAGDAYTLTFNVHVDDPDAHYARAAAAGATIVAPLAQTTYGARGYVAADCEGYLWNFSTYRPARVGNPVGRDSIIAGGASATQTA